LKSTLLLRVAAVGVALFAACCVEPPRVYHEAVPVPMVVTQDGMTPTPVPSVAITGAPVLAPPPESPPPPPIACSDLACGDFTIAGMMTASSFREGPPVVVDVVANVSYQAPVNATTLLVYPNGDTGAVTLPCAADVPGRILRVKAMGTGWVDVHGAINQDTGLLDTIDAQPFYSLQSLTGAAYPSVTLQAFYDDPGASPFMPHRTGWAVIAVSP
jgi:hypothetical protein